MNWSIIKTNRFQKRYKTLPTTIQEKFKQVVLKFLQDPFNQSLRTHKLKWKLEWLYSSSINDEYRFVTIIDMEKHEITFVNIWTHEIYK